MNVMREFKSDRHIYNFCRKKLRDYMAALFVDSKGNHYKIHIDLDKYETIMKELCSIAFTFHDRKLILLFQQLNLRNAHEVFIDKFISCQSNEDMDAACGLLPKI